MALFQNYLSTYNPSSSVDSAVGTRTVQQTTPAANAQNTKPLAERAANTQQYLNDYNANREQKIRDMYAGANESTMAGLKSAYDQNMSAARQARDEITPQYQEGMNQASAEYERQRRNNNMQAAANGLNTGAGSQMALGQMNAYQQRQGQLATAENQALDRANQNILDLKTNYQNQIAQATANNNYQQAAALLDEYGAQYDRQMNQAKQLADFGDFSMYASIYGTEAAEQMEKNWSLQNPDLAYNLGKMTAEEYFQMTGKRPRGYTGALGGIGGYGYGGGYSGISNGMPYRENVGSSRYNYLDARRRR